MVPVVMVATLWRPDGPTARDPPGCRPCYSFGAAKSSRSSPRYTNTFILPVPMFYVIQQTTTFAHQDAELSPIVGARQVVQYETERCSAHSSYYSGYCHRTSGNFFGHFFGGVFSGYVAWYPRSHIRRYVSNNHAQTFGLCVVFT